MKYEKALVIATEWVRKLKPFCDRIEIAGSIRREKPEVKDIEIVCIPKVITWEDLFQNKYTCRHLGFIEVIEEGYKNGECRVEMGDHRHGKMVKLYLTKENIFIDLFTAQPDNWGHILAIRTGPADYSHRVLGNRWCQFGYHSENGMLMRDDRVIPIPEEEDLYRLLQLPYLEPKLRTWPLMT